MYCPEFFSNFELFVNLEVNLLQIKILLKETVNTTDAALNIFRLHLWSLSAAQTAGIN
jgi:hypothetical protein